MPTTRPFGVPFGTTPDDMRKALRADVEDRLRQICSAWSIDDFDNLVEHVTNVGLKYIPYHQVEADD